MSNPEGKFLYMEKSAPENEAQGRKNRLGVMQNLW